MEEDWSFISNENNERERDDKCLTEKRGWGKGVRYWGEKGDKGDRSY